MSALSFDDVLMKINPAMAALRVVEKHRGEVAQIISILSFRDAGELGDSKKIERRADYFLSQLEDKELAQLLMLAMDEPKAENYLILTGLADEHAEQARIAAHKNKDGHNLSFGGKTIYGTLIDAACRAYGWRKEYVVWGIDLVSLRLMLADTVTSVYISDKEAEELGLGSGSREVFGMTKEDFEKLKRMDWS